MQSIETKQNQLLEAVVRFFKKTSRIWAFVFLVVVLLFLFLPLILLFVFSFTTGEVGSWNEFSFELYSRFFQSEAARRAFFNTFVIAFGAASLATIIGSMAAVGLFYLRKWRKKVVSSINQITLTNATVVTAVSLMLFFLSVRFIPLGYVAIIIAHTMICIPFVILVVTPRLAQLNPNLLDAGMDLGASPTKAVLTVLLPQLVPAIFAAFCLSFAISLDDFILASFVRGEIHTVSTYIFTQLRGPIHRREHFRAIASLMFLLTIAAVFLVNWYIKRRRKKAAS